MRKKRYLYIAVGIAILIAIAQLCYKGVSANSLLEIIFNLNYSFLAAVIFFILQTVIPNSQRKKKAKLVLQRNIDKIVDDLDFLVAFTKTTISFQNDEITVNGIVEDSVYFQMEKNQQIIRKNLSYREFFQTCIKQIKGQIVIMKSNSLYSYMDEGFITIVAELEAENLSAIGDVGRLYPLCRKNQNLKEELLKLEEYYTRLSAYTDAKGRWSVNILGKEEFEKHKELVEEYKPIHDALNEFLSDTIIK